MNLVLTAGANWMASGATLFMTKVFDILLDPYHGSQMLRTQLQIRLQTPSKDYKKKFPKILGRMEKKDPPSWKMVYETRILHV